MSRQALGWALEGLVVAHLSVARIAEALAVSWNTANSAILGEGRRLLIDPAEFRRDLVSLLQLPDAARVEGLVIGHGFNGIKCYEGTSTLST